MKILLPMPKMKVQATLPDGVQPPSQTAKWTLFKPCTNKESAPQHSQKDSVYTDPSSEKRPDSSDRNNEFQGVYTKHTRSCCPSIPGGLPEKVAITPSEHLGVNISVAEEVEQCFTLMFMLTQFDSATNKIVCAFLVAFLTPQVSHHQHTVVIWQFLTQALHLGWVEWSA